MPIRGINPMGPDFFALAQEGKPEYPMEARTAADHGEGDA
jgi:hypothetical protein